MATQVCETLQLKDILDAAGIMSASVHSFSKLFSVPDVDLLLSFSEDVLYLINPKDLNASVVTQWAKSNGGALINDAFAVGKSVWVLSAGKISKFNVASKDGDEFDLAAAYDELGGGSGAREATNANSVGACETNLEPKESRNNFVPTPRSRFVNPLARVAVSAEEEDQEEQDTFDDYFADFQEMFAIGESHYSVAAGFISKKVILQGDPSG